MQLLHGAAELGQGIRIASGRLIDPEDAVFIAVEGTRLAAAGEITFCGLAVAEKALAFHKQQLHQLPSCIVDKDQQGAPWGPSFEPVIGGSIDLDQLPKTGSPLPHLIRLHFPGFLRFPQFFHDHDLAHTAHRNL